MKKLLITLGIIVVILAAGVCGVFVFYRSEVNGQSETGETVEFVIAQGESADTIAENLKEAGLIKSKTAFKYFLSESGYASSLQYGTFELAQGMGYEEILEILTVSVSRESVTLTFPEGTTALAIAQMMEEAGLCTAEEFLACANGEDGSDFSDYGFWNEIADNEGRFMKCEGYLFPDTYDFFVDDDVYSYVDKFYSNFESKVYDVYALKIEGLDLTFDEVIILASFVQEEGTTGEFENVAEVFLNRLEDDSPVPWLNSNCSSYIQSDDENNYMYNTIAVYYGGWDEIPEEVYSAYDTYTLKGLTAGAISNPGLEAIKAVLYPNEDLVSEEGNSPCYYFVTDLAGKYYYGATLGEHNTNVSAANAVNDTLE